MFYYNIETDWLYQNLNTDNYSNLLYNKLLTSNNEMLFTSNIIDEKENVVVKFNTFIRFLKIHLYSEIKKI